MDRYAIFEYLHELHAVRIEAARTDTDQRGRLLRQHHAWSGGKDLAVIVVVDLGEEVGIDVVGFFPGKNLRPLDIGEKWAVLGRLQFRNDFDGVEALDIVGRVIRGHRESLGGGLARQGP